MFPILIRFHNVSVRQYRGRNCSYSFNFQIIVETDNTIFPAAYGSCSAIHILLGYIAFGNALHKFGLLQYKRLLCPHLEIVERVFRLIFIAVRISQPYIISIFLRSGKVCFPLIFFGKRAQQFQCLSIYHVFIYV